MKQRIILFFVALVLFTIQASATSIYYVSELPSEEDLILEMLRAFSFGEQPLFSTTTKSYTFKTYDCQDKPVFMVDNTGMFSMNCTLVEQGKDKFHVYDNLADYPEYHQVWEFPYKIWEITVTYKPATMISGQEHVAQLFVKYGDVQNRIVIPHQFFVYATGIGVSKYISTNSSSINFGTTAKSKAVTKYLTVNGSNLTGSLSLSTNSSYYTVSPTTISAAEAKAGKTVTVTYKPTAAGSHSATLTINGGGATEKTVSLSGKCAEITPSVSTLSYGTTAKSTAISKTFTVNGVNLTGSLTLSTNNSYYIVSPSTITAAEAKAGKTVTVTYKPTASGSHSATLTIKGGSAADKTVSLSGKCAEITSSASSLGFGTTAKSKAVSKTLTVKGVNLTGSITLSTNNSYYTVSPSTITAANAANGVTVTVTYKPTASGSHSATLTIKGGSAADKTVSLSGKCAEITSSASSLSFSTTAKSKAVIRTLTVKGSNLTGSLSLSTNSSNYTVSPTTITAAEAANGVTVTVTYKPTAAGTHSATLTIKGGSAADKTVSLSGKCAEITSSVSTLSFGTTAKSKAVSKTLTVKGANLTGSLTLSTNSSYFTVSPATITAANAANGVTVTVTYKPTASGTHSATLTIKGGSAADKTVSLSGKCAEITSSASSLSFGTTSKGKPVSKTFTVKGTNLTGNLTVSSNSTYFTVSPTTITVAEAKAGKTVTVTFKATALGTKTGTITVSGGDATSKSISVSGTCVVPPVITTSESSLRFAGYRDSRTLKVTGTNLTGSLTLSTNNEYFTVNPTTITAAQAAAGYTVTVQCNVALNAQRASGVLTISGGGASAKTVQLTFDATGIVPYAGLVLPDDGEQENELIGGEFEFSQNALGNLTTDVSELIQEAKIYAEGQNIVIESPAEQSAVICDVAGRAQTVNLQVGRNEIPVSAGGLYIVRVGEKTAKLMLR